MPQVVLMLQLQQVEARPRPCRNFYKFGNCFAYHSAKGCNYGHGEKYLPVKGRKAYQKKGGGKGKGKEEGKAPKASRQSPDKGKGKSGDKGKGKGKGKDKGKGKGKGKSKGKGKTKAKATTNFLRTRLQIHYEQTSLDARAYVASGAS